MSGKPQLGSTGEHGPAHAQSKPLTWMIRLSGTGVLIIAALAIGAIKPSAAMAIASLGRAEDVEFNGRCRNGVRVGVEILYILSSKTQPGKAN